MNTISDKINSETGFFATVYAPSTTKNSVVGFIECGFIEKDFMLFDNGTIAIKFIDSEKTYITHISNVVIIAK